jgi:hypothetical protein
MRCQRGDEEIQPRCDVCHQFSVEPRFPAVTAFVWPWFFGVSDFHTKSLYLFDIIDSFYCHHGFLI